MPQLSDLSALIDDSLLPLLRGRAENICIMDPPGHQNVGDSAIFLGEMSFLRRHFPSARFFFYDCKNYTPASDRFIEDATVILLHGGGNFGDIWPHHQEVRLSILERFPHKRIIQLPQSIHFDSDEELRRTAALIEKQEDFFLMVRDWRSEAYAKAHFSCPVLLSPDMAFAMSPLQRRPAAVDYFALLRTDKEGVIDRDGILDVLRKTGRSVETGDWLDDPMTFTTWLDRRLTTLTGRVPGFASWQAGLVMQQRERYAAQRLERGVEILSRGSTVVADRLHAHILCTLLSIPHYVFDSFDGKISALHATWEDALQLGRLVSSPADLAQAIEHATAG